jgi:hypothetical protein
MTKKVARVKNNFQRKYQIDSLKKGLRKNIFNYIRGKLNKLSSIQNIKAIDRDVQNNTQKNFERTLMLKKVALILKDHYNLDSETVMKNLTNSQNSVKVERYLNMTFLEVFMKYKKSKKIANDTTNYCKKDEKKLKLYNELISKYLNYVLKDKVSTSTIPDDEINDQASTRYTEELTKIINNHDNEIVKINSEYSRIKTKTQKSKSHKKSPPQQITQSNVNFFAAPMFSQDNQLEKSSFSFSINLSRSENSSNAFQTFPTHYDEHDLFNLYMSASYRVQENFKELIDNNIDF